MLRAIGGDDFAAVKPKFRETVFGMLERGKDAKPVSEQLTGIQEKFEEYFVPKQQEPAQKNTPQFSQQATGGNVNPTSKEDELFKQRADNWK